MRTDTLVPTSSAGGGSLANPIEKPSIPNNPTKIIIERNLTLFSMSYSPENNPTP
jgi:hypothetical protein